MDYHDSYQPIDPDFTEMFDEIIKEGLMGKLHFFDAKHEVATLEGVVKGYENHPKGEYLVLGDHRIRMDKIITIFGKPGPAYDTYEHYANICFSCTDFGQF